jgi:cytochrome c biogenesis factor
LQDFHTPYKPQYWFFESLEFGKKLLLVGVVPWASGDLVGAVIALVITAAYLLLLTRASPYAQKSDDFLAICSNALLFIVIQLSVLLKMNAAYIAGTAADGLEPETASKLLVACNLLVVVMSVASYVISVRQAAQDEKGLGSLVTTHDHGSPLEPLLHSLGGEDQQAEQELREREHELREREQEHHQRAQELSVQLREREQDLHKRERERDQAKISELLALLAESGEGDLLS